MEFFDLVIYNIESRPGLINEKISNIMIKVPKTNN